MFTNLIRNLVVYIPIQSTDITFVILEDAWIGIGSAAGCQAFATMDKDPFSEESELWQSGGPSACETCMMTVWRSSMVSMQQHASHRI